MWKPRGLGFSVLLLMIATQFVPLYFRAASRLIEPSGPSTKAKHETLPQNCGMRRISFPCPSRISRVQALPTKHWLLPLRNAPVVRPWIPSWLRALLNQ